MHETFKPDSFRTQVAAYGNRAEERVYTSGETLLQRSLYPGKKVYVLYNGTVVVIYLKYEKVAVHKRNYKPYGYTYLPGHQASSQRVITEWNPEKFLKEASCIHTDVENYIRHVIEEKPYPEQACKSCRGILSFVSRVGGKRLINACRWASS